jgi:hypothetical protein
MKLFSKDKHSLVRGALASNPNTDLEILRELENDIAPQVRDAAQNNISSRAAGESGEITHLYSPALGPWLPIAMDEDQIKMLHVAFTGNLSEQEASNLLTHGEDWVRASLAFPHFSFWTKLDEPTAFPFGPSILDRLLCDESGVVRAALARNPHIPKGFYEILAKDQDRRVPKMLCQNPNTPMEILESLAKQDNWELLVSMTQNDSLPMQ